MRGGKRRPGRLGQLASLFSSLLLGLYFVFSLFPFFQVVRRVFTRSKASSLLVSVLPTLENLKALFQEPLGGDLYFLSILRNSFFTVVGAVLLSLGVGILVLLFTWGRDSLGRRFRFLLFLLYFSPVYLLGLPVYLIGDSFHLLPLDQGMVFAYQVITLPLVLLILLPLLQGSSYHLLEAAVLEGANPFQITVYVLLPFLGKGFFFSGAFALMIAWQQFTLPFWLGDGRAPVHTRALMELLGFEATRGGVMAGALLLSSLPVLLLALLFQKELLWGFTLGLLEGEPAREDTLH